MAQCSQTSVSQIVSPPPQSNDHVALYSDIWIEIISYLSPSDVPQIWETWRPDLLAIALTSKWLTDLAMCRLWRFFSCGTRDKLTATMANQIALAHVVNAGVLDGETKYLEFVDDTWTLRRQLPKSACERVQMYLSYVHEIFISPSSSQNTIWPIITLAIRAHNILSKVSTLYLIVGGYHSSRLEYHWTLLTTLISSTSENIAYHDVSGTQLIPIHALILAQRSYKSFCALGLAYVEALRQTHLVSLLEGDTTILSLQYVELEKEKENVGGILNALSQSSHLSNLYLTHSFEEDAQSWNLPIGQKYRLNKLTTLEFSYTKAYAYKLLKHLACPELLSLSISTQNHNFKPLFNAASSFPKLQLLKFENNAKFSGTDIKSILSLTDLTSLSLFGKSQVATQDIVDILSAFTQLQSLEIGGRGSVPLPPSILFTITRTSHQPLKLLSLPLDMTADVSQVAVGFSTTQSCVIQELRFLEETEFPITHTGKMEVACFLRAIFSASTPIITPLFNDDGPSQPLTEIYDIMRLISRVKYGYVV